MTQKLFVFVLKLNLNFFTVKNYHNQLSKKNITFFRVIHQPLTYLLLQPSFSKTNLILKKSHKYYYSFRILDFVSSNLHYDQIEVKLKIIAFQERMLHFGMELNTLIEIWF